MSGNVGYEAVNKTIEFVGNVVAGGITVFKKRNEIAAELKDTQVDEVIGAIVGPGKDALTKILDAIKA